MENAIEIKNLKKKYEDFELKGIDLTVPKGMIVGFIGENGAGKTTTIKAILNLIKSNADKMELLGKDIRSDEKRIKEDIGVVLDDSFLSEYLNLVDIDKVMRKIYKNWDEKLYYKYIELFKLPHKKILKEYSSGMKMKLKIITAISHHPKLLILDEPTNGLDPIARNDILDIFQDFIQNEENSILVSSHITSDLEHISDYIVFIADGKIIFTKEKDELLDRYGIVKCSIEEFKTFSAKDYIAYKKNRYNYEVLVDDRNSFKKKYKVEVIDKPTLEEIMLIYVKGKNHECD